MKPVRFADLVDGPHRGERVRVQWGQPTLCYHVEQELLMNFDMNETAPAPLPRNEVMYRPMERGENRRIRDEEYGEYQIEQWSVNGDRYEYERLFWAEIARANRQANIEEALRVIASGGRSF